MMNTNFVCFDCRKSAKSIRSHWNSPKCSSCRRRMVALNWMDYRVPKKDDTKAWDELKTDEWVRKQLKMIRIQEEENGTVVPYIIRGHNRTKQAYHKSKYSRRSKSPRNAENE